MGDFAFVLRPRPVDVLHLLARAMPDYTGPSVTVGAPSVKGYYCILYNSQRLSDTVGIPINPAAQVLNAALS